MKRRVPPRSNFETAVKAMEDEIRQAERAIYSPIVLREAENPSNIGRIAGADAYAAHNGPCGDRMEIYLVVRGGKIKKISYTTTGCGASIATGSMLTKMAAGRTTEDAKRIKTEELMDALGGLPEEHAHCAQLAVTTLKLAIAELDTAKLDTAQPHTTRKSRI